MQPVVKVAVATVVYGLVHSLLASAVVKRLASAVFGEHKFRAYYRPFYIVQAVVTTGALIVYATRFRTRTLYHVHGFPAHCLRAGQLVALLHLYAGVREVGLLRITGVDGLLLRSRDLPVPEGPVAQGPEMDIVTGTLTAGGPFRWSRHPLNFSALPLFWLTPKLTTARLAFNLVATLYLVVGSRHEELRLHRAYGASYTRYLNSGVPFFLPLRLPSRASHL